MLRRWVEVSFSFEGTHCYRGAPDEVAFLRSPHRHVFVCSLRIPVAHDERELEFLLVQRAARTFAEKTWYGNLGTMSCEAIAVVIVEWAAQRYGQKGAHTCGVFEDGENGAIVELEVE